MSAIGNFPGAVKGVSQLKERLAKNKRVANYQPVHPNLAAPSDMSLVDEPFWNDLPDILQAQVLVALDYGRPKKGQPMRAAEKLLWAGTPFLRTRTILSLFAWWVVLLIVPVFVLVELVDDVGGWIALGWAFCSVFIFVPRISRSSRVVHVLTTQRAFTSTRTMFCSIETAQVRYENVVDAKLKLNADQTGTLTMTYHKGAFEPMGIVCFDRIRDLRNACRVLDDRLPADIRAGMGFGADASSEMTPAEEHEDETRPIKPAAKTVAA